MHASVGGCLEAGPLCGQTRPGRDLEADVLRPPGFPPYLPHSPVDWQAGDGPATWCVHATARSLSPHRASVTEREGGSGSGLPGKHCSAVTVTNTAEDAKRIPFPSEGDRHGPQPASSKVRIRFLFWGTRAGCIQI